MKGARGERREERGGEERGERREERGERREEERGERREEERGGERRMELGFQERAWSPHYIRLLYWGRTFTFYLLEVAARCIHRNL